MTKLPQLNDDARRLFSTYRESHRDVFLEEIQNFIAGASNTRDELSALREAVSERRRSLSHTRRKRGRPLGRSSRAANRERPPRMLEAQSEEDVIEDFARDWEQHGWFRTVCGTLGNYASWRNAFLAETFLFILNADKRELTAIKAGIAERTKSRGLGGLVKERGRPDVWDDDDLMYRARVASWRRIIDGWPEERIAVVLCLPLRKSQFDRRGRIRLEGTVESVRRHLKRLEGYLAAMIWRAMPPYCFVRSHKGNFGLRPETLNWKPVQQMIHFKTGLPFKTIDCTEADISINEQCKRVVSELLKNDRGLRASADLTQRKVSYRMKLRDPS